MNQVKKKNFLDIPIGSIGRLSFNFLDVFEFNFNFVAFINV